MVVPHAPVMLLRHNFHRFPNLETGAQPRSAQKILTLVVSGFDRMRAGAFIRAEHFQDNALSIGKHKRVSRLAQNIHQRHHHGRSDIEQLGFFLQQQFQFLLRNGMNIFLLRIDAPPARTHPG